MNKNRKLIEFWTKYRVPFVYDDTLSLYQLVLKVIKHLNLMIGDQNELKKAIKEFLLAFDEDLSDTVELILKEWKDDGSLKEIINEALFESKLDKEEFYGFKEIIEGKQNNLDDKIKEYGVSVVDYGADNNGVVDSFEAFNKAVKDNEVVFIPKGTYKISKPLNIDETYKLRKLCGLNNNAVKIVFENSGIVLNKRWVQICNVKLEGKDRGSGIRFENSSFVNIDHVVVSKFKIGVDLSDKNNFNITIFLNNIRVGYNVDYGILMVGKEQRNNISIVNSYINKNGRPLVDDLDAPALTDRGHGMMITGGYGVEIRNNVFEYNAGAGLYISNKDRELHGVFMGANYYERNKLANLYVDNSSGNKFKKVVSKGSFFSDAGHDLVENAKSDREVYITNPEKILCPDRPKNLSGNAIENISKEQLGFELSMIDPENLFFMFNDMTFVRKTYGGGGVHNREGRDGVLLHDDRNNFSPYFIRARVNKGVKYKLEFNYKNLTGADTPNLLIGLYDGDKQKIVRSLTITSDKVEKYYSLTYTPKENEYLRLYLAFSEKKGNNLGLFMYNIRLVRDD